MKLFFEAKSVNFEDFIEVSGIGFNVEAGVTADLDIDDEGVVWITETGAKVYKTAECGKSAMYVIVDLSELGHHGTCIPDFGPRKILRVEGEYGVFSLTDCADPIAAYSKERHETIKHAEALYDSYDFRRHLSPANKNKKEEIIEDLAYLLHGGRLIGTRLA